MLQQVMCQTLQNNGRLPLTVAPQTPCLGTRLSSPWALVPLDDAALNASLWCGRMGLGFLSIAPRGGRLPLRAPPQTPRHGMRAGVGVFVCSRRPLPPLSAAPFSLCLHLFLLQCGLPPPATVAISHLFDCRVSPLPVSNLSFCHPSVATTGC
jgi:hypothetical protein